MGKNLLTSLGLFFLSWSLFSQSQSQPHPGILESWHPDSVVSTVLEGSAFLPPLFGEENIFFTADNRRLYSYEGTRFSSLVLPRRTISAIEPLDSLTRGLGILRLSDNTGFVLGPNGLLTNQLSSENLGAINDLLGKRGFPFAPGGLFLQPNQGLRGEDYEGRPLFILTFEEGFQVNKIKIIDSRHLQVDLVGTPRNKSMIVRFSVSSLNEENSFDGRALPLEVLDPRSREYRVYQREISIQENEQILGILVSLQSASRTEVRSSGVLVQVHGTRRLRFRTFEGSIAGPDLDLSDKMPDFRSCFLGENGYLLCSSTQWQLEVFRFSSDLWDFQSSRTLKFLGTSFLSSGRVSLNPFIDQVLRDPLLFEGYIDSLRKSNPGTITIDQRIAVFRIVYFPIHTGRSLERSVRLKGLEILLSPSTPRETWFSIAQMLQYEYDPVVGIRILELLAEDFWLLYPLFRESILFFLSQSVNRLDEALISSLLRIEAGLRISLNEYEVRSIFPPSLWQRILIEYPTPRIRNMILNPR